jgi:uncharacterized protein (TIGR02246 family)
MRFLAAILMFLLAAAAPSSAPAQSPRSGEAALAPTNRDERAIRDLAEAWRVGYNAGDAEGVTELYTDDAYYLSAHVLAHGRDEIRAYWRRGIAAGGHVDWIEPIAIHYTGRLGYAIGRYQATNAGVTVDGRIIIVVKKVGRRWRMAAHETVVRDQP